MIEVSILVCSHNEAHVLEQTLSSLQRIVVQESLSAEVVIVDAHSDDETVELASKLSGSLPELHLRIFERRTDEGGFGSLVRYGLANASGRYAVLVAADGSDPIELIPRLVAELRTGKQMVICSRYLGSLPAAGVGPRFQVYQSVYRSAIQIVLRQRITDSTNGFRGFDRAFIQSLGLSSTKFAVCPEMTFKAILAGGEIAYVPGQPTTRPGVGSEKFKLRNEISGYAFVLARAILHRAGVRWF